MGKMSFATVILALGLPIAVQASPKVETLVVDPQSGSMCNEQRDWCLGVDGDGAFASSRTLRSEYRLWDGPDIPDPDDLSVWPTLIRLSEDRALAGVILTETHPFSGGGMTVATLNLFEVTLGDTAMANGIATIPLDASAVIRACFDESDVEKRLGACHDEYEFKAELTMIGTDNGLPDLQVETLATRFPQGASRNRDSTTEPPLTSAMLVRQVDPVCTYQATYSFDAENSVYVPNAPVPDCAEFLEP